jgi:hypothetical protein
MNGTVQDLVVVTLLRVNAGSTKDSLGKALFNFLSMAPFRSKMVELDLVDAIVELSKIELLELLELSTRVIYNLTCDVKVLQYAKKLSQLNVPSLLVKTAAACIISFLFSCILIIFSVTLDWKSRLFPCLAWGESYKHDKAHVRHGHYKHLF